MEYGCPNRTPGVSLTVAVEEKRDGAGSILLQIAAYEPYK
jgi:hypothetical protein